MNGKSFELLEHFVPRSYSQQAQQALSSHETQIRILLEKRKLPEEPWNEERIELFLNEFSLMDSNNYLDKCGLGEREGRVFSNLVSRRNYRFSHGIGRSGDLVEVQPKAIGSSVINKLTNDLVTDLLKISGLTNIKKSIISPMATGMTLSFCMMSIREKKPEAKYVIMPRIDQKSCIKSIMCAGFKPVIIECEAHGDELVTNLKMIESKINELKSENIACILSTTSCFAPRGPDNIKELSLLCKKYSIFHLINNAYGLQSSKLTHLINESSKIGRIDLVVQSTDKNLMVPVGGAIMACFDENILSNVTEFYPGRASFSQTLDVLITLLSMGSQNYRLMINERKECFIYLKSELEKLAQKFNEKVLESPNNTISIGFTLSRFGTEPKKLTQIGSMLFTRFVSGVRVVVPGENKTISGHLFQNFGCHSEKCNMPYLTAAAAIGIKKNEIDLFIKRLQKVLETTEQEKSHV